MTPRPLHHLDQARNLAMELASKGWTVPRIQEATGLSPRTICDIRKTVGVSRPRKGFTIWEEQWLRDRWDQGKTTEQIAGELERTLDSVRNYIRRHGLHKRKWTNLDVLERNLRAENAIVEVVLPTGERLVTIQDPITEVASRHGVCRSTVRRLLNGLQKPGVDVEKCANRGRNIPKYDLWMRASDYFAELSEVYGVEKVVELRGRLRKGESPRDVTEALGMDLNLRILERHFIWGEGR